VRQPVRDQGDHEQDDELEDRERGATPKRVLLGDETVAVVTSSSVWPNGPPPDMKSTR
jgi:hypothetical protein